MEYTQCVQFRIISFSLPILNEVHYGAKFLATGLCLRLRIYIITEAGFRFQTEFKTEVNLSIGSD